MSDTSCCKRHPKVAAGWTCNWCHAPLCPDCVALKFAGGGSPVDQCCLCGGQAQRILRKRSEIPYLKRLPSALAFPLNKSGLLTILAAGLFVYVFRLAGSRGAVVAQAILWGYVFNIIRAAANGKKEIEPPEFTGLGDLLTPGFHGGLATMIVWLPALLYVFFVRPAIWPEPRFEEYEVQDYSALHPNAAAAIPEEFRAPKKGEADLPAPPPSGEGGEEGFDEAPPEPPPEGEEGAAPAVDGPPDPAAEEHAPPARAAAAMAPKKPSSGPPPLWRDPFLWLIFLFGVLYAPMALVIASAGGGWLEMLSPFRVFMAIKRIPGDYLVLVGAACGLALMMGVASLIGSLIDRIPIPLIPGWIAGMLSTYPALVTGQAFGLLLYVRGSEIGYLPPGDAYEQMGEVATPRGTPPGAAAEASAATEAPSPVSSPIEARFAPIGVAAGVAAAGAAVAGAAVAAEPAPAPAAAEPGYQRYKPISLDEMPAVEPNAPAAPVPLAQALQQALAAKDLPRVQQLYAGAKEPLPATLHYEVGRAAGGAGNNPLALQALKAVVQVAPQDPLAPKALVLAARVYGERMGDAATAAKIYSHIVAKYPGTEAAAFAQQRLAAAAPK